MSFWVVVLVLFRAASSAEGHRDLRTPKKHGSAADLVWLRFPCKKHFSVLLSEIVVGLVSTKRSQQKLSGDI